MIQENLREQNNNVELTSQLSQPSEDTIISFSAFFNEIDKHFDKILDEEGFSPFNEKLKKIAEGRYPISNFVKKHQYQLRYFGELRNFITHSVRNYGKSFAVPTPVAIEKLARYAEIIKSPAKVIDVFRSDVFVAKTSDYLKDILPLMKAKNYTKIPVYNDAGTFVGVLSENRLLHWLSDVLINQDYLNLNLLKIEHLRLKPNGQNYAFVASDMTIYEVDTLFSDKKLNGERFAVAFITENGNPEEEILGIISSSDVNVIDHYLFV